MSGGLVAGLGPSILAGAVRARLERLRLHDGQRMCVETHRGFCAGVLEHPVISEPGPFRPFVSAGDGRYLALLHGRIDNLGELAVRGQTDPQRWALQGWLRGGAEALSPLVGSFVLMIADLRERELCLIRDPLGDRSVFYRRREDAWWIASEEAALWPQDSSDLRLDQTRVAEFFAIEYPSPGRTWFSDIAELPPAHRLKLGPSNRPRAQRYWNFRYRPEARNMPPDEAAEGLVARLERAIRDQADSVQPLAVAASGGMDSTAVAALVPAHSDTRLYTYRTPGFPGCDEVGYVRSLAAGLGAPAQAVVCDQHWPLSKRFFDPPWLRSDPGSDAYRAMRFELIRAAVDDGCRIMLTGDFGDHIYCGHRYWLRDLFSTGRWMTALRFLGARLLRHGLIGLRGDPTLRRLLPWVGITRARQRRRPWLTESGNGLLSPGSREHPYLGRIADIDRVEGCINNFSARTAYLGHLQGLQWGVEIRTPFRDRRLLEFALSLPAHYLYDPMHDTTKAIMRRALRGRLPSSILERRGKTSFEPLFRHGLLRAHRKELDGLLANHQDWRRFVRSDWLSRRLLSNDWDDVSLTVLWNCVAFCLWRERLVRGIVIDSGPAIG